MLMKTNEDRYQVSGVRGATLLLLAERSLVGGTQMEDEGSSGYVDENKATDKLSV